MWTPTTPSSGGAGMNSPTPSMDPRTGMPPTSSPWPTSTPQPSAPPQAASNVPTFGSPTILRNTGGGYALATVPEMPGRTVLYNPNNGAIQDANTREYLGQVFGTRAAQGVTVGQGPSAAPTPWQPYGGSTTPPPGNYVPEPIQGIWPGTTPPSQPIGPTPFDDPNRPQSPNIDDAPFTGGPYAAQPFNPGGNPYANPYASNNRAKVPNPWSIHPGLWDSMGNVGRELSLGFAEDEGWDAGDYQRQLNESRPQGTAPRQTQMVSAPMRSYRR